MVGKMKKLEYEILFFLAVGFLLRIFLSPFGTLELDFNTFISWSRTLSEHGFSEFYNGWSDYLPGYLYVLYFLGKISVWFSFLDPHLVYKLPAIIADMATAYLIYKIVRRYKSKNFSLMIVNFYIFNPAVFANSSLWGQVDSLTSFFSIAALYFLDKNSFFISSFLFSYGVLVKPQTLFILPVIFFVFWKKKWRVKNIFLYILFSAIFFFSMFIPFSSGNLIEFVFRRVFLSLEQYPYTSVNAINFWSIFGFWKSDTSGIIPPFLIGYFISFIILSGIFFKAWRRSSLLVEKDKYYYASIVFFTLYLFMTRMHERHLLPVIAPLLIAVAFSPFLMIVYVGLSFLYVVNLYYSYVWITDGFREVFNTPAIILFSLCSIFLFVFSLMRESFGDFDINNLSDLFKERGRAVKTTLFKGKDLDSRKARRVLIAIILFLLVSRIYGIGTPEHEYFDEIYHAFTAKLILHGDPKAWEWWNPHPEGFAYEWTHPPLAKEIMAVGMYLMGESSYGYRVPAVIFGVGVGILVYFISYEIFKDRKTSLFSVGALSLEGLFLVMSRIGMNDIYFLFFMLLSLYMFLRSKYFFSSLAFGFSLASKWTAFWFFPLLVVAHFSFKKKFSLGYFWYLLIPATLYVASYTPMFLTGHDFSIFTGMQKQMWWYHTNLEAEHAYTSPWWSWPLLIRPVWFYTSSNDSGLVANIYAMGNPVVVWFGLLSIAYISFYSFRIKSKRLGFVVLSYLMFFVPWAFSPRIMFFYHYLPSIPFLSMGIGVFLRMRPKYIFVFFFLGVLAFLYFYPHWTGIFVPRWINKSYYWIESWR